MCTHGRIAAVERARKDLRRPGEVAAHSLDDAYVRNQPHARGIIGWEQRSRARDEVHRRGGVAAEKRAPAGGAEPQRRASPELSIGLAEVRQVAERLLEVVADDLFVLGEATADLLLEPCGVPLVQGCPCPLRDRVVRGVADEQMAEAEASLTGEDRRLEPDEVLADERR